MFLKVFVSIIELIVTVLILQVILSTQNQLLYQLQLSLKASILILLIVQAHIP